MSVLNKETIIMSLLRFRSKDLIVSVTKYSESKSMQRLKLCSIDETASQGRRWKFVAGGSKVRGSGDGSPPVGFWGKAPIRGLGDKVPQKLKHFLKNRY